MKKIWLAAFFFIVVVTFSASLTQAAESAVTLQETFEGEYGYNQAGFPLDKIGKASTGAYGKSYEVTNELAYSGEKSMKVMSDTNWWGIFFRANTLVHTAPNGKRYTISFQVAGSPENTKTETLTVKFVYDSVTTTLGTISPKPGEWTEFSAEYAFASNAFENGNQIWEKCEIFIEQAGQGNTYYFDDVLMEEIDPNIALELDFEDMQIPTDKVAKIDAELTRSDYAATGSGAMEISKQAAADASVYFKPGGSSILSKEQDTSANVYEISFQYAAAEENEADATIEWYYSYTNDSGTQKHINLGHLIVQPEKEYKACRLRFQTGETNWMWWPEVYCIIKSENDIKLYIDQFVFRKVVLEDTAEIEIEAETTYVVNENGENEENDLSSIERGKTYGYALENITSSSMSEQDLMPVIALYHGDRLVSVQFASAKVKAAAVISELKVQVTVPDEEGTYSIKVFKWDNFHSMQPVGK